MNIATDINNESLYIASLLREFSLSDNIKIIEEELVNTEYKAIFKIIVELIQQRVKIDPLTVLAKIKSKKYPEEVINIVKNLQELPIDIDNFNYYQDRIKKLFVYRQLYNITKKIQDSILIEEDNILENAEEAIINLSLKSDNIEEPILVQTQEPEIRKHAEMKQEIWGIPTGYPILDKFLQGLIGGRLYIVKGSYKQGKSVFLENIGKNVSIYSNIPVLYIDLEPLSTKEVYFRLISMLSQVEEKKLYSGYYRDDYQENEAVEKAISIVKEKSNFYHKQIFYLDIWKIRSLIRKYVKQHGVGLILYDFIRIPEANNLKDAAEWQKLGTLTHNLKTIATELDIPIIAAVQKNIDGEAEGSRRVPQFGSTILSIQTNNKSKINFVVDIEYNRHGETVEGGATINFCFDKPKLTISEV